MLLPLNPIAKSVPKTLSLGHLEDTGKLMNTYFVY